MEFAIIVILCGFILLIKIIITCFGHREVQNESGSGAGNNRRRPPVTEGRTEQAQQSKQQEREERRFHILTNIVHKKVVAKTEHDEGEEQIILPHEHELSHRSITSAMNECEYDEEAPPTEEATATAPDKENLKTDITIKALSSWRKAKSMDSMGDISSRLLSISGREHSTGSLYSPKTCPICIDSYKVGDDICWSRNESCPHAFHLDCMVEWLMDHDECPLCREKYLETDTCT